MIVDDTIAAIATAPGPAGVGIVRLSGARALAVLEALTGRSAARFADRRLIRAELRDGAGGRLDDALCVAMRGPRSFTGEDVVELHGHGGALNLGRVLAASVAAGARIAEPGEFSRRALRAGRLDALQAEALLAVIEAGSERALRAAQAQLAGGLGDVVDGLAERTRSALAAVEASIDFPEEDLAPLDRIGLARSLAALTGETDALAESHALGAALRDGLEVVLRGAVNAGKSSLFNALLGRERALVADAPGTTRDYLEARAVWDGVPVTLIDTAGDRGPGIPSPDEAERRGIELGARRAAEADVEVWLVPGGRGAPPSPPATARRRLVVASKADMEGAADDARLAVSAVTGAGVAELKRAVLALAVGEGTATEAEGPVVATERQRGHLRAAVAALARGRAALADGLPEEVVALELREAASAFGAVRGERADDAVLDELFARFCIGK